MCFISQNISYACNILSSETTKATGRSHGKIENRPVGLDMMPAKVDSCDIVSNKAAAISLQSFYLNIRRMLGLSTALQFPHIIQFQDPIQQFLHHITGFSGNCLIQF